MSFDNRPTDRQSHAHATGLGCVEWVEEAVEGLWIQSRPGILHYGDLIDCTDIEAVGTAVREDE
jgi:hypothetical protein